MCAPFGGDALARFSRGSALWWARPLGVVREEGLGAFCGRNHSSVSAGDRRTLSKRRKTALRREESMSRFVGPPLLSFVLALGLFPTAPTVATAATVTNPLCPAEFVSFNPGQGQ